MSQQARYWLLTIPVEHMPMVPQPTRDLCYIKGQQELGNSTGLLHWQILAVFTKKLRLRGVKSYFVDQCHAEATRSEAANDYVWKEETRVAGTQFEYGSLPLSRARKEDWGKILDNARSGKFDDIPADIYLRYRTSIRAEWVEHVRPLPRPDISVNVFWGESGTGKTKRAFEELGDLFYLKNPNTKWWDGYRGEPHVLIDEFTGRIDLSYLLLWLDRYPCCVEVKGSQRPLCATTFWITSNINPRDWYLDINEAQRNGLMRRLTNIVHFNNILS